MSPNNCIPATVLMLIHAIAHRGCTDIVRESALTVDSVRKITCRSEGSNPRQYCVSIAPGFPIRRSTNRTIIFCLVLSVHIRLSPIVMVPNAIIL